MKAFSCLFLCIFLLSGRCFSQYSNTSFFYINQLPPQGVLLDKNWKFHAGDNMEWAKASYNDNTWQPINPTQDVYDLLQLKEAGIGWFRLHLKLDSSLLKESLVFMIEQTGASEIYLNGKLIYTFGKVHPDQREINTFDPLGQPVSVQFNNDPVQVLAVRFAYKKNVPYFKFAGSPNLCFALTVNTTNQAVKKGTNDQTVFFPDLLRIGIFLILSLLHFALFKFYPKKRANLYFSLFAFTSLLAGILLIIAYTSHFIEVKIYSFFCYSVLFSIANLIFLKALYVLTHYNKKFIFHILTVGLLVTIPLHFWPYHYGWIFHMNLLFYAILIECVRVSILAVRRKQKGAFILAMGALGFIINWSAFDIAFILDAPLPSFYYTFTFSFGILSLPIATSVFLALEFAFTNRSLEAKVIEVQQLSEKTLAQEKEKQQIFAAQNETLEQQVSERTAEVVAQKEELQTTLENLKATQVQLIQKEKMASLGELTAGIAHEIQNPLNFVNNFSEVSTELVEELQAGPIQHLPEIQKEEAQVILSDLRQNLAKISQHGKRADNIVKNMLQHSRVSSGEKHLTDINALADEYLRLSYHGLRAKDKDFNANIITDFDPTLGKLEVVPQDIGRVLLNLFNNAFYATQQKKAQLNGQYQPQVQVSTKVVNNKVEIRVRDNGNGIPENVKSKIFQPFFTTKPTGEGTGLGLSLSYDIITKGHGGELTVDSKEREGSEFIIELPIH